ncbi:MAG TPA: hypothetical protein VMG10_17855 [Gemmataceae bacterium]|nr:hypothetical protein [Gemmataceae bacterium]
MLFQHFLRSLFHSSPKAKGRRPASPTPLAKRVRMYLETLEDRIVPSTATLTNPTAGNGYTLTITDPTPGAQICITEVGSNPTGNTYCVSDSDLLVSPQTIYNVQNIKINLSGNLATTDSVTLTNPNGSYPNLKGSLSITDNGNLDQLCVNICPDFNVNGNVNISAPGSGSTLYVTSSCDTFGGNVSITGGTTNAKAVSSSVCLSNDSITGNLTIAVTAGTDDTGDESDTVNLSCDDINGNVSVTETAAGLVTECINVCYTNINYGGLTTSQSNGEEQSLKVAFSYVNGNLSATQTGGVEDVATVCEVTVGGSLSITQSGSLENEISLDELGVGRTTTLKQTGSYENEIEIEDATLAGATTITQSGAIENEIVIGEESEVDFLSTLSVTQTAAHGGANVDVIYDAYFGGNATFHLTGGTNAVEVYFEDVYGPGHLTVTPASALISE